MDNTSSSIQNATPLNLNNMNNNTDKTTKPNNTFTGLIYVFSFLILGVSLTYSFNNIVNNTQTSVSSQASVKLAANDPRVIAYQQKILKNIPTNPDTVIATASSYGKIIELKSGEPYPYAKVTFTWEGAKAREPGTEIGGYFVYFGPKNIEIPYPTPGHETSVNPAIHGQFVRENSLTVNGLEKGKTYYLYIRSATDSKVKNYDLGMEDLGNFSNLPAKKLFTYIYQ